MVAEPEEKDVPKKTHTRDCTDVFCALVFYAYLGGMGAILKYAVQNGDLNKLTHGFNWQNEICGVTERVSNRPYLFWCPPEDGSDIGWDFADGICLSSCPGGENELCPGRASQFHLNISDGNGNFIITSGVNRTTTSRATYASTPASWFCVPDTSVASGQALAAGFTGEFADTSSITQAVEGVRESRNFFVGVAVFVAILGYAFLAFVGHFIGIIIKTFMFIVGLGLMLVGGGFLFVGYCASTPQANCDPRAEGLFAGYVSHENLPTVGYGVGGTVSVLFLVYICAICCGRTSLKDIIDALQHAADLFRAKPTLVLLPVIQSCLKIGVLSGLIMGVCWVVSLGEPSPVVIREAGVNVHGVARHFTFTDNQFYALCFFAFGCIWLIETISALGQYVISHVVVKGEMEHHDHACAMLRGYRNCIQYHVGTIAFGGFVLGALRIVSAILALFMKFTQNKEGNPGIVAKICCCCCMCCMECLTQAVELLNELVYTDVAITGHSYMTAAKNVVSLAMANPVTYGGVKLATEILGFLGVFGITFVGTYLPYQILNNPSLFGTDPMAQAMDQQSIRGCTVVSFLISFFVSMAYMSTFNQCALALMYITLWDEHEKTETGYEKTEETGAQK